MLDGLTALSLDIKIAFLTLHSIEARQIVFDDFILFKILSNGLDSTKGTCL